MSNPKKHHYTPKAYLNAFTWDRANNGMEFFRLRKISFKKNGLVERKFVINPSHPSMECYCLEMYKLQSKRLLEKHKDPNFVEKNAFDYELSLIKEIQNLVTYKQPSIPFSTAKSMIEALLHIQLRNKINKDLVADSDVAELSARKSLEVLKKKLKNRGLYKKIKDKVNEEIMSPETISDVFTEMLLNVPGENTVTEQITKHILQSNCLVFCTSSRHPFLTSCKPGYFLLKDNGTRFGGANNSIGFIFPLSPTRLITFIYKYIDKYPVPNQKLIHYKKASEDLVEQINFHTWYNSENHTVFSPCRLYLERFRERLIKTYEDR